ncbi:hypothetical protein Rhow_006719 [Rhodococcus wratislaviensis]|uniref:Uncharacterized protein n=1 Tax=Rhodococcus wratislaviensis TaxID=44752 RepID=A0A402CG68_RHOWR|nr:hypothetical protein Rhow_006719 [Rhodococcus wratislaviensis]
MVLLIDDGVDHAQSDGSCTLDRATRNIREPSGVRFRE